MRREVTELNLPARALKVPFVKSEARADVAIVTEAEKSIYRETEENMKKELMSKRDDW